MREIWNTFVDFLWRIILSIFDFLKDFFYWCIAKLFEVVILFLDLLSGLATGLNPLIYINAIPPETKYMMQITGFNEAMGIIVAALGVRFLLQTIPFVRYGS